MRERKRVRMKERKDEKRMVDGVIIGKRITTSEKWSRITVGEKRWFLIELKDREKKI